MLGVRGGDDRGFSCPGLEPLCSCDCCAALFDIPVLVDLGGVERNLGTVAGLEFAGICARRKLTVAGHRRIVPTFF
jgi:hypothetical protein